MTKTILMRLKMPLFAALMLAFFIFPNPSSAITDSDCNKFVDAASGNDGNSGNSGSPWGTLTKAGNSAVAGNTVCVRGGTYYDRLLPQNSGSSEAQRIIFAAYPGETVTLNDSSITWKPKTDKLWEGMIELVNKNYITISGFNIPYSGKAGILVNGGDHVIVEKNRVSDAELSPIKVGWNSTTNSIIDGNTVSRENHVNDVGNNGGWEEGISVSHGNTIEVRNNHIIKNGHGECIVTKDGTSHIKVHHNTIDSCSKPAIYLAGFSADQTDITAYSNLVRNSTNGGIRFGSEVGGRMSYLSAYDNIVIGNSGSAGIMISSYVWPEATQWLRMDHVTIHSNTVVNSGKGIQIEGRRNGNNNYDVSSVTIQNNIVANNAGGGIVIDEVSPYLTNLAIDHNLRDGPAGGNENMGSSAVIASAQFLDGMYHLQNTSPAIDAGTSTNAGGYLDFDGNSRPVGAAYDIGVYEYGGVIPSSTPTPTPTPTSTPIPTASSSSTPIPSGSSSPIPTVPSSSSPLPSYSYVPAEISFGNVASLNSVSDITSGITNWLLGLASAIFIILIILGGIMYMGSTGDEERMNQAKKLIIYTIIAMAIVLISYTVYNTLSKIIWG